MALNYRQLEYHIHICMLRIGVLQFKAMLIVNHHFLDAHQAAHNQCLQLNDFNLHFSEELVNSFVAVFSA